MQWSFDGRPLFGERDYTPLELSGHACSSRIRHTDIHFCSEMLQQADTRPDSLLSTLFAAQRGTRSRNKEWAEEQAARLAAAAYLRVELPYQGEVVLARPTAVVLAMVGEQNEYCNFWELLYGVRFVPGTEMPVWADCMGRLRLYGRGNPFVAQGSAHVQVNPRVGVLVFVWVDGPATPQNSFPKEWTLPSSCVGSTELADAILFGAASARWRRLPLFIIKAHIDHSVGEGRFFYPPVWTNHYQTKDASPVYMKDFIVREHGLASRTFVHRPVQEDDEMVVAFYRAPRTHCLPPRDDDEPEWVDAFTGDCHQRSALCIPVHEGPVIPYAPPPKPRRGPS